MIFPLLIWILSWDVSVDPAWFQGDQVQQQQKGLKRRQLIRIAHLDYLRIPLSASPRPRPRFRLLLWSLESYAFLLGFLKSVWSSESDKGEQCQRPRGEWDDFSTHWTHSPFTGEDGSSHDVRQQQKQNHRSTSSEALGVTAAACEWIVALIIIAFVASFVVEFSRIRKETNQKIYM